MRFISRLLCLVLVFCVTSATCYAEDDAKNASNTERKQQSYTGNKKETSANNEKIKNNAEQNPQYKKAKKEGDSK